jgi:predicted nuclease of predicted toxin-antitoxin system
VRILLDECIDRRFANDIAGHEVKAAPQMGWASIKNGELLALAEQQFEIFVTVDRNLSFQQHLPRYKLAVIVLRARSNRLRDLRPLVPKLLEVLPVAKQGEVLWVSAGGISIPDQ